VARAPGPRIALCSMIRTKDMDIDRNVPATKGDIEDLRSELKQEMGAMEERLIETIRDSQTEMLKAFYGFMETV
jgi:hypothetical protein